MRTRPHHRLRPTAAAGLVAATLAALLPAALVLGAEPAGAATFTVTTTQDQNDGAVNGLSLRDAISASNATVATADVITLQAGATYVLDICDADPTAEEDLNVSGDLDHTDNDPAGGLTIEGNGATIEQTCPGERVLDMRFLQPLTLRDVTIRGGDADLVGSDNAHGGALRGNGTWLIEDSTFTDNRADGIGSAIANGGGSATTTIRRSNIVDNGTGLHGAVRTANSLVVEDSTVADNTTVGLYGLAGMTVRRTTVSGNRGGLAGAVGAVLIDSSTIVGNGGGDSPPAGAGLSFTSGTVEVSNSTFHDNHGTQSGGVYSSGNLTLEVEHATFTGGSGHHLHNSSGTTSLRAVVLGAPASGGACVNGMTLVAVTSFEQGTSCGLAGPGNVSGGGDPKLGPLAGNGGPTQTRMPAFASPVVDLVPADECDLGFDQRGDGRPVDGDFDGEPECDAGAVERPRTPPFTDVAPTHTFFTEIGWMAWNGISTGSLPGPRYKPSDAVSRQAMSAFLYRLAGSPAFTPPPTPTFSDVAASNPFHAEIEWMNAEGITTGFAGGVFKPVAAVSRQSMSAFMHRMAGSPAGPFPAPGFSDVSGSHPFALQIAWMADTGVSTGYDDSTFRPSAPVSRQAMSAFMFRFSALL